jgi:hypothetical protein
LGFQEVKAPDFLDFRHYEGGKVVTLMHWPPSPPAVFLVLIFRIIICPIEKNRWEWGNLNDSDNNCKTHTHMWKKENNTYKVFTLWRDVFFKTCC